MPNLANLLAGVQEAVVDFVFNNGSMANFPSMAAALRDGRLRDAAWQMSHRNGDRDSEKSRYFQYFEGEKDENGNWTRRPNDRARDNVAALNEAATANGEPPKWGYWNDVDDQDPQG